tara:strand:+ start:951 stop:2345 length:1395 start_codon:yes stop_codon:yes gene_type:complete
MKITYGQLKQIIREQLLREAIPENQLSSLVKSPKFKKESQRDQLDRLANYTARAYKSELSGLFSVLDPGSAGTVVAEPGGIDKIIARIRADVGSRTLSKEQMRNPERNKILDHTTTAAEAYWAAFRLSKESTAGNKLEDAIGLYCKKKEATVKHVDAAGHDLTINGSPIEVKSSEGNSVNTNLNASFFKDDPEMAYLFVFNTGSSAHQIVILSSDLLHKVYTAGFAEIGAKASAEELAASEGDLSALAQQRDAEGNPTQDALDAREKLSSLRGMLKKDPEALADAIEKSFDIKDAKGGELGSLDIRDIVKNTLVSGKPTDQRLTVKVGNQDIGVRLRINYTLGKFKGSDKESTSFFKESLILEELTGRDKKDIEKMIVRRIEADRVQQKKLIEDEMKKSLGASAFGTPAKFNKAIKEIVQEELSKEFKGKNLDYAVGEVTKKVLKQFYREIGQAYNPLIDRLKV